MPPSSAAPLQVTDTTFRDAQQSLAATRMRTRDMEPMAAELDQVGFHSAEVWGGATFDVATRFLLEDPWERLRTLKELMPQTPLQMLLRGQNLVGYRHYPDDVVEAFVQHAAACGTDIFRIFDALNDHRNLQTATRAVKAAGKHAQLCLCYSVTEEGHLGGPIYTLDYFLQKAVSLEEMGADSICIKDMAGLLAPYDAHLLVGALKERLRVPVQLHTHYLSGMASMTVLKAVEAGVDTVDTCLAPLALRTSQPAVEPLVTALAGTPRATGLDLEKLIKMGNYLETLAPYLHPHLVDGKLAVVDTQVLSHQVPRGHGEQPDLPARGGRRSGPAARGPQGAAPDPPRAGIPTPGHTYQPDHRRPGGEQRPLRQVEVRLSPGQGLYLRSVRPTAGPCGL